MTPSAPLTALALTALCAALLPNLAEAATPQPGKVFKDCKDCPEMVVLPAGTFTMGTPDDEVGREPDEGPMHAVTFAKPFAMSRFQITAGEWDSYIRQTGVKIADGDTRPGRECIASKPRYPQSPRQPAVCMDMDDIKHYVAWLSKKTGQPYHMVSEAQREYAARAGSSGPFPFPFDEGKGYSIAEHANTYGPADGYSFSSPAGSYPPNAFGMYDMHGNVYERVADCEHPNYIGAPTDGSAWVEPNCESYQIRGNDWGEAPVFSRSGNRNNIYPQTRGDWIGFRVVRDL
ncbi:MULTISPECIES: dihydropyoverdine dehydrogenase [Pseudomonas]|jgi:formylglycine-generating enzyme required for sulfatase activity|uniref:Formylglycine-generating enzyme family protein n=1 Tax=Pseudomonas veronii TaxID=76761 RepID=A0A439E1A5_PSEVE|nr:MULTISPECIES: formylglycine-generating enzyme family protein [Pseudomonas]AQY66002.1 chromophore maturation protein PvdO [Pseudomonas veronii]MCT8964599.1 formylglycine-generating enzyme family protein [Pseudomonas veronii]MDF3242832.1 formylglycine-generating enzyme family protein [Pseudomonas veronii]NWD57303.1 formylglycine-generating enzyme family protein [Pseudomonas veronii]PMU86097.1 formylglycine-generating enzyme family protein [Pseudomonas sp. GW704-F3]